jgi:hypothetical protein
MIIDLKQPPNNVSINMHNIYVIYIITITFLGWTHNIKGYIYKRHIKPNSKKVIKDDKTSFKPKEYQYKWYKNQQRY